LFAMGMWGSDDERLWILILVRISLPARRSSRWALSVRCFLRSPWAGSRFYIQRASSRAIALLRRGKARRRPRRDRKTRIITKEHFHRRGKLWPGD
jgi:hypothetical protein